MLGLGAFFSAESDAAFFFGASAEPAVAELADNARAGAGADEVLLATGTAAVAGILLGVSAEAGNEPVSELAAVCENAAAAEDGLEAGEASMSSQSLSSASSHPSSRLELWPSTFAGLTPAAGMVAADVCTLAADVCLLVVPLWRLVSSTSSEASSPQPAALSQSLSLAVAVRTADFSLTKGGEARWRWEC